MLNSVVALGTFDGVHLGHTAVLKSVSLYDDLVPVCLSFKGTPKSELGQNTPLLLDDDRRTEKIKALGFESVELFCFRDIKNLSPRQFLDMIVAKYSVKAICCGFNYRFGKNGEGDTDFLKKYCNENGIGLNVVGKVTVDGETVSSTLIRQYITDGNIEKANRLLGYRYSIEGEILHGFKRGRELGFPTVNQDMPRAICCPKFGVYSSFVTLDGKEYKGLTNIGNNPTFGLDTVKAETYIHGFSGNAYGKSAKIELVRFIRPEMRFDSADKLREQLKIDLEKVK